MIPLVVADISREAGWCRLQEQINKDSTLDQVLALAHTPKTGLVNGPGHKVMAVATTLAQAVCFRMSICVGPELA